jgi:hypothetical protein
MNPLSQGSSGPDIQPHHLYGIGIYLLNPLEPLPLTGPASGRPLIRAVVSAGWIYAEVDKMYPCARSYGLTVARSLCDFGLRPIMVKFP